ncbi:MAG: hypothetical protein KIT37_06895 [Steroidobacteraceae bacterium]|nr:hypothetical protein [Steroidobacteraceae bacterium]
MATPLPTIGTWYRLDGGELFEVVAYDPDDGTIEIQYFDGTVEEMDRDDWELQGEENRLEEAEAPDDWSGSFDVDADLTDAGIDYAGRGAEDYEERRGQLAGSLEGLDMFE